MNSLEDEDDGWMMIRVECLSLSLMFLSLDEDSKCSWVEHLKIERE